MAEQPHDEAKTPIKGVAGESPTETEVPVWVTACVRLAPPTGRTGKPIKADPVFPAVQALMADRMRFSPAVDMELDREAIADWAGYSDFRKAAWLFDYLEQIGFLRVQRNYEPGTGRRSADTFTVYARPPMNYVGPRTAVELTQALRAGEADRPRVLFVDPSVENTRSEPTSPRGNLGSEAYVPPGEHRVQNTRSEPTSPRGNLGSEAYVPPGEHRVQNTRSEPRCPRENLAKKEGEKENSPSESSPSIDRESATPPVSDGSDDAALMNKVRGLVRRLPWKTQKQHTLSREEARHVADAIYTAIREHGITFEQAREHARWKLAGATSNPPAWVAGGFKPGRLPETEADDVLPPLPDPKDQSAQQHTKDTQPGPSGQVDADSEPGGEVDDFVPWCGDCDPPIRTPRGPMCRPECPSRHPADA